jgi:hypothetical protein
MEYFDLEKLIVFFLLYTNAPIEQKITQLFDLIAIDSPSHMPGHATQMIVNLPEDPTIHRIFAYMAIITCLITTEILRGQESLP